MKKGSEKWERNQKRLVAVINVKCPGKLSRIRNEKRLQGFGWKDAADDFPMVSLPK